MKHAIRQQGFTIVELLIVIVVIGILAAITIVAYSGIQQRANNTAKYQAAATYEKTIQLYVADKGNMPPMTAGSACLGKGYSIRGEDTVGSCGGPDYSVKEDPIFDAALQTILGAIPQANNKVVTKEDGVSFVGVTLTRGSFMLDGEPLEYIMQFVLEGRDQDCKVPGVVEMRAGSWGDFTPVRSQKNTFYDSRSTTCVIAVPNE